MKTEITAIKKALGTVSVLEGELKPFFQGNATTMVAPIKQFLDNHLALAEREELNSKLTPELIKKNILKDEEATVNAAKRRMEERTQRREGAKAEAEKAVIAQAKADKKGKAKGKGKVVDFGSAQSTDSSSAQSTQAADQTSELSEEEKVAVAAQADAGLGQAQAVDGGKPSETPESGEDEEDELTEEEKALLAAKSDSADSADDASIGKTEEVVKKNEKKNPSKKVVTASQEPLI